MSDDGVRRKPGHVILIFHKREFWRRFPVRGSENDECQPDDSPAYYYYRLILVHQEKEFANLIFNKEKEADDALARLSECAPDMAVGYVPPPGGKKPSFR